MTYIREDSWLRPFFQLLANVLEMIGVLLMANSLLGRVPFWEWPKVLLGALCGTRSLLSDSNIAELFGKDAKRDSLQGLALIFAGFLLQAMIVLVADVIAI